MKRYLLASIAAVIALPPFPAEAPAYAAPIKLTTKQYVADRAFWRGWHGKEWNCLNRLVWKESRWRLHAANPRSSARGLFQILNQPAHQSLARQTRIGFGYIKHRYGSPCAAYRHHQTKGWY